MIAARQPAKDALGPSPTSMPELVSLERSVAKYRDAAQADNTRLAYRKQWDAFTSWCAAKSFSELPAAPATVALYLAACADAELSVATLALAKAAITARHEEAILTSPCAAPLVKEAWAGIRRRLGVAPKQKQPLDADHLRAMYEVLPPG
ncbi:MAG TPA: hypothetical protein VEX18_18795, partial [Polyangiaceae bacterium]|nr:hypothetical protein [Polyangiaceae bacterium]